MIHQSVDSQVKNLIYHNFIDDITDDNAKLASCQVMKSENGLISQNGMTKIIFIGEEWLKNLREWPKPNYFLSATRADGTPIINRFVSSQCEMIIV